MLFSETSSVITLKKESKQRECLPPQKLGEKRQRMKLSTQSLGFQCNPPQHGFTGHNSYTTGSNVKKYTGSI